MIALAAILVVLVVVLFALAMCAGAARGDRQVMMDDAATFVVTAETRKPAETHAMLERRMNEAWERRGTWR